MLYDIWKYIVDKLIWAKLNSFFAFKFKVRKERKEWNRYNDIELWKFLFIFKGKRLNFFT